MYAIAFLFLSLITFFIGFLENGIVHKNYEQCNKVDNILVTFLKHFLFLQSFYNIIFSGILLPLAYKIDKPIKFADLKILLIHAICHLIFASAGVIMFFSSNMLCTGESYIQIWGFVSVIICIFKCL